MYDLLINKDNKLMIPLIIIMMLHIIHVLCFITILIKYIIIL